MKHSVDTLIGRRMVVLGDLMVDYFVRGTVDRVSEEAPVPILHVTNERFVPGGAANVATNAVTLGGSVTLIGAIGADEAGKQLVGALERYEGLDSRLIWVAERPTTLKTRYLGGNHQILRVDREDRAALDDAAESAIVAKLRAALDGADILILSDYAKGVLSNGVLAAAFGMARSMGIPVLVDPKYPDFGHYRGATIISPNRKELTAATGLPCVTDEEAERAAAAAIAASGADILLTRSELGMSYFHSSGEPAVHSAAEAREVFDVSGAGDTVVATFGLALAAGFDTTYAMRLANAAAGIAVGKYGTSTVSRAELAAAMREAWAVDECSTMFVDHAAAAAQCARWRAEGFTIGFVDGCFDLVHPGHVRLIQAAGAACDRLVVALHSDDSARRLMGEGRPFQTQSARAQVVASIKGVSLVTLFEDDAPMTLIEKLRPDVIVKGSDERVDEVLGAAFLRSSDGSPNRLT